MADRPPETAQPDDAELVAGCARGDARSWRQLVTRYRRLVYGIPRALGLQPADADEVFQHTFSELVRALPRLRDINRLAGWLATVAHRESIRVRRGDRRRLRLEESLVNEGLFANAPAGADAAIRRLYEREQLAGALDALGDPCRRLLLARFADPPLPYEALAAELGLAIGSLGPTRARCLGRLRARLVHLRAPRDASESLGEGVS
jgi:RNA polymerase sigma factor (sigma-70 family)